MNINLTELNEDQHTDYKLNYIEAAIMDACDSMLGGSPEYPQNLPEGFEQLIITAARILARDELEYEKENA